MRPVCAALLTALLLLWFGNALSAEEVRLEDLLAGALRHNPEVLAAEARAQAARARISQSSSLPDPMLSLGFQNDSLRKYNYGDSSDTWWMISASQTFAYPGKLPLQEEAATLDADAQALLAQAARRQVALEITEAYCDWVLADRELKQLAPRASLNKRLEETALARYAAGTGSLEDVLMAQAEKYMLQEKEAMARSRAESSAAMLARATGRSVDAAAACPAQPAPAIFENASEPLLKAAENNAPELAAHRLLAQAAAKRQARAQKEALPDFTLMASYANRGGGFNDMWSLTASVPLPIHYQRKQAAGIQEAAWDTGMQERELDALRLKNAASIRDNLAMVTAADRIIQLYQSALIPKARQDIEAAMSRYAAGRADTAAVLAKLKAPFDYELVLWQQETLRAKAIARIKALTDAAPASGTGGAPVLQPGKGDDARKETKP